ncbi:FAD-binding oxidoreductase [Sphingomonas mucosissima]|uniref:D-lactate dehydrogenase (cytochrome) n=1 Tax=Sphingomonas mucosissima TaxID=370959 RepID=A0A245ZRW4_9SPHN|nr:FAD-linked oxidase C-terminal domain-containing protein [Sphingomonas mucosissima]OWK32488.1 putative FAD-linked oxidoreductase [Sphingomonas mucosissima]
MTDLARLSETMAGRLGARWITHEAGRAQFMAAEGHHAAGLPDVVAQPRTVEEVQMLMAAAQGAGVAVVPLGVGTSLEGNAGAVAGAVSVDLSGMNRVLEVAPEDLLCVVEPGVTREALNEELRATGLFFPIDPGANATLGGMISTRASGTNAVRYGTMRENVLGLKVVLPDGTLIPTGSRARKSAAGYDLTHLFTGSEGTLGLIVEATVRLHGIPEAVLAGTWRFDGLDGAVQTVIETIQSGVPVARMELLDPVAIRACNAFAGLTLAEQPTLFVELHGSPQSVREQRTQLEAIGAGHGAGVLTMSLDRDEQRLLWRARHAALPAARAMVADAVTWSTDICVPISKLAEAIARARAAVDAAGLLAPILGHVGDGNYHVFFVLRRDDPVGWEKARAVNEQLIDYALSVGGTCTGEHGIGMGKRAALVREHGAEAVALMRRIKAAIDPGGLMNPGKIFLER